MAALGVQVDETLGVFTKRWWRSKQLGLSEITPRQVDRFRDELAEQAHTIRLAEERGRRVMESATDKRGRTYERRRRPL